ncbi:YXWGXW repeat-containing protein [Edaphobacter bradus]|uniref:YXWGXW repeat-containing protein n=1 Tax=Edaphobacter bradus TaxID=2259016 RepID=UPI0021DFE9A1|nr:YXWGXW repeat-containing protein [Edaphobacter bradus]
MKAKWLYGGILASAFATPAFGQVSFGVTIGTPPPPLRYEVRPAIPAPGYVWQSGYWVIRGHRWVWVPGVWVQPPYPGAYWSHPHYDRYSDGWHVHEGHWDREDHDDHYWENHGHHER